MVYFFDLVHLGNVLQNNNSKNIQLQEVLFGANGLFVEQVLDVLGLVLEVEFLGTQKAENEEQVFKGQFVEFDFFVFFELRIHEIENEVVEYLVAGGLAESTVLGQQYFNECRIGNRQILDHCIERLFLLVFEGRHENLSLNTSFTHQIPANAQKVALTGRVHSIAGTQNGEE